MKTILALAGIVTVTLLTTGCHCCKDGSCSKPNAALCPGDGGMNKVQQSLIYIEGNLHEDSKMIFDPVFVRIGQQF